MTTHTTGKTWARGRGWELWKALITLFKQLDAVAVDTRKNRHVIKENFTEHKRERSTHD